MPIWILVGIIYLVIELFVPKKAPVIRTIMPSNEFASDWQFRMYDLDEETDDDAPIFIDID